MARIGLVRLSTVTVVAVHQPTFLPWLGWWDKLARSDVMVLLDDAQFPRESRGTWMNRVRLVVGGEPRWVTVPVVREGVRPINATRIDERQPWRRKALGSIEQSYRRAPHFAEVWPVVREALEHRAGDLAAFNEHGIRALGGLMGAPLARLRRASELDVDATGTDRLIELTRRAGGDAYLSGDGAEGYQEPERYPAAGIELRFQAFEDPRPVAGLSVVDALMHDGPERTARLIGFA